MQTIPVRVRSKDIELVLNNIDDDLRVEFLPTYAFPPGLFSLALQSLLTSIRRNEHLSITYVIKPKDLEHINSNFFEFYQLLVICLFNKHLKLLDANGFPLPLDKICANSINLFNLQDELYSITFDHLKEALDSKTIELEAMRKRIFSDRSPEKIQNGLSFFIPSFDHVRALQRPSYFYNAQGLLRAKEEIVSWVSRIFKYNKLNIREGLYRNKIHNDIAVVIKELFDNTHEWARSDFQNTKWYSPNLRSCFINVFMEGRVRNLHENYDDQIQTYISTILKTSSESLNVPDYQSDLYSESKIGICEVSMQDTGPGMARRWLRKDYESFSISEEVDAVKNCFNKYVTSDVSTKSQVRGRGLNNVVRIIGRNGFILVRTGRVLVNRNFFKNPLERAEVDQQSLQFDCDERALAEGTTVTILYPFLYSV